MPGVPKVVFIVPYRDRELQRRFYLRNMKYIMEDYSSDSYKFYFAHQCDNRDFNRGGMKNCGFLAVKNMYPDDYKDITFVFNDIDTMPIDKNMFSFETVHGKVKHFYGFLFALGGLLSITGKDFEKIGGFPNFWGWGYEDNVLQQRALEHHLTIDRSEFLPILHKNIVHLCDGKNRVIHRTEYSGEYKKDKNNGLSTIYNLQYDIEDDSMIKVKYFFTGKEANGKDRRIRDLTVPNPFAKRQPRMYMAM